MAGAQLVGCDFSSAPSARKPIVLALGSMRAGVVRLCALQRLESLPAFGQWLKQPTAWVGAFDFPFGLPRELLGALGWPLEWEPCIVHYAALSRSEIRERFVAFCEARPAGAKFAHRATDGPAGSSPSMKWVNPPVAYMLQAGVPLLLAAGVRIPGLHAGRTDAGAPGVPDKVALEGYPGLLARELIGRRSYKSDALRMQSAQRRQGRESIVAALEQGRTRLGLRLALVGRQRDELLDDGRGDALDAVLCMLQAAWGQNMHAQGSASYGLPARIDPLEGWIVSA